MGARADSIYGVLEFSFPYKAGKTWEVTCKLSAANNNSLKVLEASSENFIMDENRWYAFLSDMTLLEDFRREVMFQSFYFFSTLRRPPAEA